MLRSSELYYLNRALDADDIYGIKPDFESITEVNKVKDSLKKKKIIKENEELTDLAFLILKNLEIYKNAKMYIWINDICVSIDESNYLLFFKKTNDEEFEFKKITKELMLLAIVREYNFLQNSTLIDDYEDNRLEEEVESEQLIIDTLINIPKEDILYIRKVDKDNYIEEYNIYYSKNNYAYKYDVLKETKRKINCREIRMELADILEIAKG